MRNLEEEREKLEANAAGTAHPDPHFSADLPAETSKAVLIAFDLFKQDAEACQMLLTISRTLGFEEGNRTNALRTSAALAVNNHLKKTELAIVGMSALHNLTADVTNISSEESDALIHVLQLVIDEHKSELPVLEKAMGFAIVLFDASVHARKTMKTTGLLELVRSTLGSAEGHYPLVERCCGLLARLARRSERNENTALLTKIMTKFAPSEAVCEQVMLAAIAVNGIQDTDELVSTIEALSRARSA